MDIVYTILIYGGPIALGLLGVYVTETPPGTKRGRRIWWAVFGAIAIASVAGAVFEARSRDERLEAMLIGGDNYAYLWAEVGAAQNVTDKVPLWIKATGLLFNVNYWIAPASVTDPNDDRYWSIGGGFIRETRGGIRVGRLLGAGKYRVEFSARNGSWIQILEIKPVGDNLVQSIEVFRHGEGKIYSENQNGSR